MLAPVCVLIVSPLWEKRRKSFKSTIILSDEARTDHTEEKSIARDGPDTKGKQACPAKSRPQSKPSLFEGQLSAASHRFPSTCREDVLVSFVPPSLHDLENQAAQTIEGGRTYEKTLQTQPVILGITIG